MGLEPGVVFTVSSDVFGGDSWVARSVQSGGDIAEETVRASSSYRTKTDLLWATSTGIDEWPGYGRCTPRSRSLGLILLRLKCSFAAALIFP